MNVVFTSLSFICKYQEAFDKEQPSSQEYRKLSHNFSSNREWQLTVNMTMKQKNLLGNINYNCGGGGEGASSAVPTYPANVQEAVVEA